VTSFFPYNLGLGLYVSFFVSLAKDLKEKVLFSCTDGLKFWASLKQIVGAANKQFDVTLSRHGCFDWSFVFLKSVGEDCSLCKGFLVWGVVVRKVWYGERFFAVMAFIRVTNEFVTSVIPYVAAHLEVTLSVGFPFELQHVLKWRNLTSLPELDESLEESLRLSSHSQEKASLHQASKTLWSHYHR
jgi:hypothetical protein